MKEFILKYNKRLWLSGLAGMGFGFIIELIAGIFITGSVPSLLMITIILGSAVGAWYILANNKDFKK